MVSYFAGLKSESESAAKAQQYLYEYITDPSSSGMALNKKEPTNV
jgi:hypothetical protein